MRELKEALKKHLASRGITVTDLGTHGRESTDYPEYARSVARALGRKQKNPRTALVVGLDHPRALYGVCRRSMD